MKEIKDRAKGVPPKRIVDYEMTHYAKTTLDNDIPVFSISGGSQELVRIEMVFDAGSYYQTFAGQALICSKLMLEGTAKYSGEDIANITEYYGSYINSSPEKDIVCFTITCLNKHLDHLLPVLQEVICKPSFPQEELDKMLISQKHDLAVDLQKSKSRSFLEFQQLIYGTKSQYRSILDENEFDLLTRDRIVEYYNERFSPQSCRFYVSGLPEEDLPIKLNKFFGHQWGASQLKEQECFKIDCIEGKKVDVPMPNAMQAGIIMGHPVINRQHEDFHYLDITNTILGGYFGSRLMSNIREDKGYTYGIYSQIVAVKHHAFIYITTEVASQYKDACLKEIYKEIDRLRTEEVSMEELEQVRSNLLGTYIRSLDGPMLQGTKWKTILDNKLPETFYKDYLEVLMKVTPKDILRTAQKYLDADRLIEVIVGA